MVTELKNLDGVTYGLRATFPQGLGTADSDGDGEHVALGVFVALDVRVALGVGLADGSGDETQYVAALIVTPE